MELDASWVTGFVDGEGCFHVGISRHGQMANGVQILPEFTVVQHERDAQLLYALKRHFGCGVVRTNHGDRLAYRVRDRRHLVDRIVPFFVKHRLLSRKRADFEKFRRVLRLMERDRHLTAEGIEEIRAIAGQMNRGAPR